MNSVLLDSGENGARDSVVETPNSARYPGSHLITLVRWCATIVAALQLILAGINSWVLIDLHLFGTPITLFAFGFAATFIAVQIAILLFAWTLPNNTDVSLWFLALAYSLGLAALGLIELANINSKTWILQPGVILPPNEIMGRDWPLAVAMGAFGLAQLLGIVPLILVIFVWMRRGR